MAETSINPLNMQQMKQEELARQLMVGNYLIVSGVPYKVNGLDISALEDNDFELPVSPIALSPGILLKAGFEQELIDTSYPEEGHYYSLRFNDEKYCDLGFISGDKNGFLEVCLIPYEDFFRFRYLHQIQNIYHLLTGKQLSIEA